MNICRPFKPSEQQLLVCTAAADKLNVGVAIIDSLGFVIFWNQWLKAKSGLCCDESTGLDFLTIFPELKGSRLAQAIEDAIKHGLPSILSQSLNKAPLPLFEDLTDRSLRIQQAINVTPIECGEQGRFCLIQVNDVSIAVKKERLLREQAEILRSFAFIDSLTGIANRRRLDEYLADEFKRAARSNSPLSVIMLDIDYFKQFNDTYGHQNGDFCLKRVANAIKATLNRPADLVGRYGGEEFAIILPDTSFGGASTLAEEIRKHIESLAIPHEKSKVAPYVTLSLGISNVQSYADTSDTTLLTQADHALYQAKTNGRNRVEIFRQD
jgi:diguanylate cyclase (GGDEF)-like protein